MGGEGLFVILAGIGLIQFLFLLFRSFNPAERWYVLPVLVASSVFGFYVAYDSLWSWDVLSSFLFGFCGSATVLGIFSNVIRLIRWQISR